MAEAVLRQHKRRTERWMDKRKYITTTRVRGAAVFVMQCVPGYLLSFADVVGIPSGLYAAFCTAMAAGGWDIRPTMAGSAAAFIVRLLAEASPRWENMATLLMMLLLFWIPCVRNTVWLMVSTAVVTLPTVVAAVIAPTVAEMLQGWGSVVIATLSAPVMVRAIKALAGQRHISSMEERISIGYFAAMCLCGGARMLLFGFNIGMLLSACLTIGFALTLGVGAAMMVGILAGAVLALQGIPLAGAVALAMGGFLCGVANSLSRKRLSCGCFAASAYLVLLLSKGTGLGCGISVMGAALAMGLMPGNVMEVMQRFFRRFIANDPASGDAYAAATLTAWEQTIAALARAVPSPRDADRPRNGEWWQSRLCQGCPEYERCGCMTTELALAKAEAAWAYRSAREDVWQGALEQLRGMGCQRLYYLLEAMNALRREDEAAQRVTRQAEAQRDMLITHLTAMSGAARRFAMLSSGESWWDDMTARRIRHLLEERAIPVTLSYVRRIQGHAQAAFELHFITGARKQAEDLCLLVSVVTGAPMQLASLDGDRILLTEQPFLKAEVGTAAKPITGGDVCGDTAWTGYLQDGRYLIALSDGMGHGAQAALASRQTVELLRLCLDAGYSRQQTLTAVNGMMLLGGGGECFATADVLTIDLWKGHAALDKLGAAASWLYQQGMLTRLTGDTLPLGIIEDIDPNGSMLRLCEGDAVILLTDGVEDAFRTVTALENALVDALQCESPADAAQSLLEAAYHADGKQRRDDQSALFVYIRRQVNASGFTPDQERGII